MSDALDTSQSSSIAVAGASGTIGRAVVRELLARGRDVVALVREGSGVPSELEGARIETMHLSDTGALAATLKRHGVATLISCLASRSGSPRDAQVVDFEANANLLRGVEKAEVEHFILLSAICVQRPKLAFQHAKLAFEAELAGSSVAHTIVRPTAFFKSLSGQVDRVREGKPFFLFGDGELTACKPISDADLARFIANQVDNAQSHGRILPIGGPGPAITLKRQGETLFEAAGLEPRFRRVPVAMFTAAARVLSLGALVSQWFAQKAEYARIARYYATESMLVLDPETGEYSAEATPEFGNDTLADHYAKLIEGME